MMRNTTIPRLALLFAAVLALATPAAAAELSFPQPGMVVLPTAHGFDTLWERLEVAVEANDMGLVTRASASRGAAGRGVTIPGNAVIGVYRNDFAVRMLRASVAAGIEAPLRFYLTEDPDGGATLAYRRPSAAFKPYGSAELDALAAELDEIFAAIAAAATAR